MSDCINNGQCKDLTRLEQQLKDFINQNGEDHKEIRDRLSKVELTNAIQNERYEAILDKLDSQDGKLDNLSERLSEIESKPAKRWDVLIEKAIWAVVAAVIAFLLAKIGLTS